MSHKKTIGRTKRFYVWLFALVVFSGLLVACATSSSRTYSSVVEYLYPGKAGPVEKASIPVLSLPLKVGIAFVPEVAPMRSGMPLAKMPARGSARKDGNTAMLINYVLGELDK